MQKFTINIYFLIAFVLICLIGSIQNATGAIFTVTNQADTGVGTLREAITFSNDNGSNTIDYIYFNLPGASSTDRTVTLNSLLPEITTSLVIDGSSQPGTALAINGANVIVQAAGPFIDSNTGLVLSRTDCFVVKTGASVFELYGLIIRNFFSAMPDGRFSTGTALFVDDSGDRLVIGSVGKGNVFYNNGAGMEIQGITNSIIKSNLIGIMENGLGFSDIIQIGLAISPGTSCIYGGNFTNEGNIGFGTFSFGGLYDNTNLILKNNIFNANTAFERTSTAESLIRANQFHVSIFSQLQSNISSPSKVLMENNVMGCDLLVAKCNGIDLNINSNTFGTSPDKISSLPLYNSAIHIEQTTGHILIGGDSNKLANIFTNVVGSSIIDSLQRGVVEINASTVIELSHNSFYCNILTPFLYQDKNSFEKPIIVSVSTLTTSSVTGKTKPGARIELFYADMGCTGCQPQNYIASINADTNGNWAYNSILQPDISILASASLNGSSSEFTDTKIYLGKIKIHDVTCNSNGSISGITVANATQVQWLDEKNNVVGNNLVLQGVTSGKYRLKAQQFSCTNYSPLFTIKDAPGLSILDASVIITNDQCDQRLGAIKAISALGGSAPYNYIWRDSVGQIIGHDPDIAHLGKGKYILTLTDADNCTNATKSYTITNTEVVITTPLINDVIACSSPVLIRVTNPVVGTSYRIYNSTSDLNYLQQEASGVFNVKVKSSKDFYITQLVNNCESKRVLVRVKLGSSLVVVNNVFTPNGDGINDYWNISGIENFPSATTMVFNRYGAKVFESKNIRENFDGNFNGIKLPTGPYYYIINLGSGCTILSGSLTIIR